MPHPILASGPNVMMPPPILSPPGIPPQPSAMPVMPPPIAYGYGPCPPQSLVGAPICITTQPMKQCTAIDACHQLIGLMSEMCCHGHTPATLTTCAPCAAYEAARIVEPCEKQQKKVHISATPSSDRLEMNIGEDTCIHCKKMAVKMGDNEITLSVIEGRIRVRGDELKATADSVRSDGKDHLILEGDAVLHYKKDGHIANVTGDRIDLNLSSGAVTIKPIDKAPACQTGYISD
ncbi:MAG: hypothetical protein ACYC3I_22450 [Gemmataceae bacterium]